MTQPRYRLSLLYCLAAGTITACASDQQALAQTRFSLSGELSRTPTQGDDALYQVAINVQPFLSPEEAEIVSLVGPNGTAVPTITPDWHSLFLDDLTLEQARSVFSGTWTFTELRNGSPLEYQFDLPEVEPDLFPSTPVIVSPDDGTAVGSSFVLDWEYPDGRTDSGFGFRSSFPNGVRVDSQRRELLDDSSAWVPLAFDEGVVEGELTLKIGQSENMSFDVTPVSSGADASFVFQFVSIKAFSLPLTVVGRVPEPTTGVSAILALGIVGATAVQRPA